MSIQARHAIPKFYYYITPLFILLDYVGGLSVRAAVLDSTPMYTNIYYGFCIICGISMYIRAQFSAFIALFESTSIVLMTVLSVFLPYIQFIMQADDVLNENWDIMSDFSIPRIANLMPAGTMAIIAYYGSIDAPGISKNRPHSNTSQ